MNTQVIVLSWRDGEIYKYIYVMSGMCHAPVRNWSEVLLIFLGIELTLKMESTLFAQHKFANAKERERKKEKSLLQ